MSQHSAIEWTETDAGLVVAVPVGCEGWRRADLSDAAPGLGVSWTPSVSPGEPSIYAVTHIASGYAIAKWFMTRAGARAFAEAIAPLTDWTQSKDALLALPADQPPRSLLRGILQDYYSRERRGDFGLFDQVLAEEIDFVRVDHAVRGLAS